ncbi:hypothetical protein H2248_009404 [Termitomyces sp. 'cryptogamus']|nr:hypothetical protein H2248_009404 [Termitomyces sp. 'cryptogamus']
MLSPAVPEVVQRLLHGYSFLELPDLSGTRNPQDHVYTTKYIINHSPQPDRSPHILLAISRILGAYCGVSDILLALCTSNDDLFTFVRVTWADSDAWNDVLLTIEPQIQSQNPIPLSVIRRALDIDEKQSPCIVICQFSSPSFDLSCQCPLTFAYDSLENNISLTCSTKHLHASISSQLLTQVALTIAHIETSPATSISHFDLPSELMSQCERTRNEDGLAAAYPHLIPMTLATDYLTRRSITHPNSIALQWFSDLSPEVPFNKFESLSYLSFHRRANKTARWLRKMGLEIEDRVAVCMTRDILFHIAMIGIMRAGGCYVPIDPDLPWERKAYIARDSNARFVLTTADVSPTSLFGASTLFFEANSIQTAIREESHDEVEIATPDSLAFLLYTSGTTGNPKGCLLTNKGLSQAIVALSSTAANVRMNDLSQGRYLAVASVAFDVHLGETFVPIALGMPLVSALRSQLLENLPFYVKHLGITHLGIVPSLIEATLGAVSEENEGNMTLRYIASGGEKMSDAILDKWADHPEVRLANFYGPSEATIGCCARYMDPETPRSNIGCSFSNVAGYVVDTNLNILPRGGIGELVVEGPLVGRGYIGRPDLTEKVFLEWPQKGDWAYRTGDLVRMMPDCTFEIIGRIDSQIKLRGVRIESDGISSIIRQAVTSESFFLDASTILGNHPSIRTEQIVSFVTWDLSVPVSVRKTQKPAVISPPIGLMNSVKDICEVELPRYMRPSHIIPLSWLPLSSNGKTDTKVLAQIFDALEIDSLTKLMANTSDSEEEKRPANQLEMTVSKILARHVTIPLSITLPELNLFACGLDSMAAIKFAKDLHDEFGCQLSASDIMSTPTLAGVASLIEKQSLSHMEGAVDSYSSQFSSKWLTKVRSIYGTTLVESILPPYSVQEGVLSRSADNDTLYVQHVIVLCKNHTSMSGLRRAWQVIMTRHPILRTVFFFGSELVQVILNSDNLSLPWYEEPADLGEGEDFVQWFLSTRAHEIARDINRTLSEFPGFRLFAFVAHDHTYLVLSIHHALYDGISLPLLFQDVEREYHTATLLSSASPSEIVDRIACIDLEKAREFWLDHFRGFVWPQVSVPSQISSSGTIRHISRFNSNLSYLKDLSASQNVTLQTVLTTAFAVLAATRIYHVNDISFGIIRSGRLLPIANIENAICPMVSIVPRRVNFSEPGNILHNMQSRASAMIEVEHIPLSKVQNWVRPGRAIFDLLFSVSIKADNSSDIWDVLESQPPEADYPLSVEVVLDPCQDTAIAQAVYKGDNVDGVAIQTLLDDFEAIALDICAGNVLSHFSGASKSNIKIPESVENNEEDHLEFVTDPRFLSDLRQLLSDFLGVNETLLTEGVSFVSLGLDSVKSVGLARTLKKAGHNIRAEEIMKYATLQMLASRLTSAHNVSDNLNVHNALSTALARIKTSFAEGELKLSSADKVTLFPTTTLQAGMLSQTIASHGSLYLHAFPLRLHHKIEFDKLEKAWMQVIESLDILRTSFHFNPDSGIWAQVIHSVSLTAFTKENFETDEDYEHKFSAFIGSIRLTKESDFHIPPIWLRLFIPQPEVPSGETPRLVLVMHHSLYDGFSIGNLLAMVQSIYLMTEVQTSIQPTQFHTLLQHILHQEEHGTSFWTRVLTRFHPSRLLPRAVGAQCHNASHTASRTFPCDPVLLADTLRHIEVTVQSLGQATWGKLMAELTGSTDVVFGHTVSGRSIPDAEGVIGPVLNTVPCRARLNGVRNIDLLRSIHKLNVDALPWQHASLRSIQRELGFTNLWDSLFVFQPHSLGTKKLAAALWSFDEQANLEAQIQYAVVVEMCQLETGFMLKAACRSEHMLDVELEALLLRFQSVLENLMLHLDSPALEDLSIQVLRVNPTPVPREAPEEIIPPLIKSLLTDITSVPATGFTSVTPLATLGIDSITAIQIVSRFRRAGLALSINDIIISRTVGDMVSKVGRRLDNTLKHSSSPSLQLPPDERAAIIARIASSADAVEDVVPMSSGMKWILGSWQKSGRTAFHHAFAFQLPADIDASKLQGAWKNLLKGFPILRSTFACASGTADPRLVIFKPDSIHDSWVTEKALDRPGLSVLALRMKELLSSPPSMSLPPTRAIFCKSSEANYFILYLHHFQYDAWSLPLIINDLSRLYLGLDPRASSDIHSFLQVSGPTPDNLSQQKQYWQEIFGDNFVPTPFPSLLSKLPESHRRTLYVTKEAVLKASLCVERARLLEVSLSSVLLACWAEVQGSYSSSSSITIGLWQAGRSGLLDDITSLALPCLNIIPMQIPVPKRGEVIEIAKGISNDLQARSPVIVQSDLVNISQWVGVSGRSLCNVVVNIIGIAPETIAEVGFMKPAEVPYYVPPVVSEESNPTVDRLATTELIQVCMRTVT